MQCFNIFLVVVLAIGAINCEFDDNPREIYENINSRYLKGYLRQRQALDNLTAKVEAVCPGKGGEFEESLNKVKECVDQIEESQETVCSVIKNHFLRCTRPMVKVFEDCFPEESKDIPSMIFKTLTSATAYICKADGEHIFELMNSCVTRPNYRFSRCERKIRTKVQQFKRKMPTKSDLCEFAHSFKPCLQSHLLNSCGNEITRESVMGLYDAMFSSCSDINEITENVDIEVMA